jgi:hypothetical protein
MAPSQNFHQITANFDVQSFDATLVTAIKSANFADCPLTVELKSVKDKLGICHFAPPRTKSFACLERDANNSKMHQQEMAGEDKSHIAAKTCDLDHSGKLDTNNDLHGAIANFFAIATFVTNEAADSKLWKSIKTLHVIWLHPDGKNWLSHHLRHSKHLVASIVMQFQVILGLCVKTANCSVECRQAVKSGKAISPLVCQNANLQAKHVAATMNNLIPAMTLGQFVVEPLECKLFYLQKEAAPAPASAPTPRTASNDQRQSPA